MKRLFAFAVDFEAGEEETRVCVAAVKVEAKLVFLVTLQCWNIASEILPATDLTDTL